jgi:hypothetical protein
MSYKSLIIGLSALLLMAMVPGRGHLKFDESFKDLGEVKQGDTKTYSFTFTNTGDKKLKIASVSAVSNCLKVLPIKDSVLAPDAGGEILIEFDTMKHTPGEFAFGITVNSNADNKEVKLKMFGALVN